MDTNIIIYSVGKDHPYKEKCQEICLRIAEEEIDAVTSVEVLQEILYRYWSIGRLEDGLTAVAKTQQLTKKVLPVSNKDISRSSEILKKSPQIPPRDAIHIAVMLNNGLKEIISTDKHLDTVKGIKRIDPLTF